MAKTKVTKKENKIEQPKKLILGTMTVEELKAKIRELKQKIAKTKLEIKAGRQRNVRMVFNLRKQVAAVKTHLSLKKS